MSTAHVSEPAAGRSGVIRALDPSRGTDGPLFLNCPRCGLSIRVRAPWLAVEHCPRCLARARTPVRLFFSPLSAEGLDAKGSRQMPTGTRRPHLAAPSPAHPPIHTAQAGLPRLETSHGSSLITATAPGAIADVDGGSWSAAEVASMASCGLRRPTLKRSREARAGSVSPHADRGESSVRATGRCDTYRGAPR